MAYAAEASRFLLGFVFLGASVPKLRAPSLFQEAVANYQLVPEKLAKIVARVLPGLELLVALLLLVGIGIPVVAITIMAMLSAFVGAVGVNLARGRAIDCGCRGGVAPRRIGWKLIVEDLLLVAVAVVLLVRPPIALAVQFPWFAHASRLDNFDVLGVAASVGALVVLADLAKTAAAVGGLLRGLAQ